MRTASDIRAEIAEAKVRLRNLKAELRGRYSNVMEKVVALRQAGHTLERIAAMIDLPFSTVVNNLHRARVFKPGKRLHEYPQEQQKIYRKFRRNGFSAERARAEAGMLELSGASRSPTPPSVATPSPQAVSVPTGVYFYKPSGRG